MDVDFPTILSIKACAVDLDLDRALGCIAKQGQSTNATKRVCEAPKNTKTTTTVVMVMPNIIKIRSFESSVWFLQQTVG